MKPKLNSNLKKVTKQKVNRRHWLKNKSNITAKRNASKTDASSQSLEIAEKQTEHYSAPERHELINGEGINNQLVHTNLGHRLSNCSVESVDQIASSDHSIVSDDENNPDKVSTDDFSEERPELDSRPDLGTFENQTNDLLERDYDVLDIAVLFMLIKKKHRCSNTLIDDLLKLLNFLNIRNIPSSWFKLKSIITGIDMEQQDCKTLIDKKLFFCPRCEREVDNPKQCTNDDCSGREEYIVSPHTLLVMNIQRQIENILKSVKHNDLVLKQNSTDSSKPSFMSDVCDGSVYKDIIRSLDTSVHKKFISLCANIDGVAIFTSSEQSMWTFIACVNEIRFSARFKVENMILLGVSVGRKKPSKMIMQLMLKPIVERLKQLENPNVYQVSFDNFEVLRVYLIGLCNDKPANSLVQNLSEPNSLFGCSKCEIAGITTPAKLNANPNRSSRIVTTYIRIFPSTDSKQSKLRSNARWYTILHASQNGMKFFTHDGKSHTFGYQGDCELTNLLHIDRGKSFMSDNLHSIYHGAWKRLLQLWTESSNQQPWSLKKSLTAIDADLNKILYPTTTVRTPRSILKSQKLKANECRVLLLIGYPIFKKFLEPQYYTNLQCLAFGVHIGESSSVSKQNLIDMKILLSYFVDKFPYPERFIVQTVHCIKHFASTVEDFGPLSRYSTFHFESTIGCLSASLHGTNRIGVEVLNNFDLWKKASYSSENHCLTSSLHPFMKYLQTGEENRPRKQKLDGSLSVEDTEFLRQHGVTDLVLIQPMKSIVYNGLRLSIRDGSKFTKFTDSNVSYNYEGNIEYGFIERIFHIERNSKYLLKIRPMLEKKYDFLILKHRKFINQNITYGRLDHQHYHLVSVDSIIEKVFLFCDSESSYFARLPNLYESS